MASWRERVVRRAPLVLVGVLPTTLLAVGVARFVINHFFATGPFLLDSGWYSAIVHRAGLFPANPPIACDYATWYYGVHVSPLMSAFSAASYLVPLPRIEWYAVVEAVIYIPIGIATYLVASRLEPASAWRRLPITIAAALAFAFSGHVIAMVAYPHYEAAIPGLVCCLLAALVTRRQRLAWGLLVATLIVREDAGLHAALALAPLVYLQLRGVTLAPSRRTLLAMAAAAIGYSIVAMACQKLFFGSANLLRHEYLGDPLYAHITIDRLVERARNLLLYRHIVWYPVVATCLIAALCRDARYLLGWAVALPWFAVNFLAVMDAKAEFAAYTVFPFVVSMFWVYLYGAFLAPPPRRLRAGVLEALFVLVCVSSAVGYDKPWDQWRSTTRQMLFLRKLDRAAVHGFVDALGANRARFGRLYVDYAVAALALEHLRLGESWRPGVRSADAIAYHRRSAVRPDVLADAAANGLDTCTTIVDAWVVVCTREPLPPGTFGALAIQVAPRESMFH